MAHPLHHSESSARKFGGCAEDYLAIHNWFDQTKSLMADYRHRALRHHAEGIFLCEQIFGTYLVNRDGKKVPVRFIGEQHVKEDLGWIPSAEDWLSNIQGKPWMFVNARFGPRMDSQEPESSQSSKGAPNEKVVTVVDVVSDQCVCSEHQDSHPGDVATGRGDILRGSDSHLGSQDDREDGGDQYQP